jgi:hypothetical protein
MTEQQKLDLRRELIEWDIAWKYGLRQPLLIPVAGTSLDRARRQFRVREMLASLGIEGTARADGNAGGVVVERLDAGAV